ncbi:MAG: hypothetical protein ABL874_11350 [Sphingopyxis sp.]
MMLALAILLALSVPSDAPSLTALADGGARCDRPATTAVFQAEETRRTQFLTQAYAEQETIVLERRALAARRAALRTATVQTADSEAAVLLAAALNTDRQTALDDARLLERLRHEAIDQMRRQFLSTCGDGRRRAGSPAPPAPAPTAENAP